MRPSDDDSVLSKNNAKALRRRNAIDAATFHKHTRQLEKERNSEERLFLKNRKLILQRQSGLVGNMSPRLKRNDIGSDGKQQVLSASCSSSFLVGDQQGQLGFLARYRSRTISSRESMPRQFDLRSQVSLPDIFATTGVKGKTAKEKRHEQTKLKWRGPQNDTTDEETCRVDYWKKIRECRYLRACPTEKSDEL